MVILNVLLGAFIVHMELGRPRTPAASAPAATDKPKVASSPQAGPKADERAAPASPASPDPLPKPVESAPAAMSKRGQAVLPEARITARAAIRRLRAGKTSAVVVKAPEADAAKVSAPPASSSQPAAPVRGAATPAAPSANVKPSAAAASVRTAATSVPVNSAPPRNAPVASILPQPSAAAPATRRVASIGLQPSSDPGWVKPKMPVAPLGKVMEIVRRPVTPQDNCGDDKTPIPCPTLHHRFETEDPAPDDPQ
jgi:hypothetical protein